MKRVTVWHDGGCPLCRREIALMRRLDTRDTIGFVDVAGFAGCPLDRAEMLARFHAREADGPLLSGAAAFAAMWRAIPLLRPLGQAARNPVVLSLLERLYLRFLRIRPHIQRWLLRREARASGHGPIPPQPTRKAFGSTSARRSPSPASGTSASSIAVSWSPTPARPSGRWKPAIRRAGTSHPPT